MLGQGRECSMDSPASSDCSANGASKCAAFGSVGMSMALPKPAGTGAVGASAASQAFKRQRTAPSVRCQDSKGADLIEEECLGYATSRDGIQGQQGEEDNAEEERCPLCHQLTLHPLQGGEFELRDQAHSGYGPHSLRQALSNTTVTPHQLVVNGGLLLATFLGQKVLRWMLKRRRRKGSAGAPVASTSPSAAPLLNGMGQNTCEPQDTALLSSAAPLQDERQACSQAHDSHTAQQASGSFLSVSNIVETSNMQRHTSAVPPTRPNSRQALARSTSPEEVNRCLYQYAALALQQPVASKAKRR